MTIQQPHAIRLPGCPARAVPADQKKRFALDSGTAEGLHALIGCGAGRGAHCPSTPSKKNSTSSARLPVEAELHFCALNDVTFPFSQFLRQSTAWQSLSEGEKSQEGERESIAIERDEMKDKGDGLM